MLNVDVIFAFLNPQQFVLSHFHTNLYFFFYFEHLIFYSTHFNTFIEEIIWQHNFHFYWSNIWSGAPLSEWGVRFKSGHSDKCSTQTQTQAFQWEQNLQSVKHMSQVNIFNLGHINKKHIKDILQRHMSYQHVYVSLKSLHSTVTDLVYRHLLMFGLCAFRLCAYRKFCFSTPTRFPLIK